MINRAIKPEPTKEISFELPSIKEFKLANNLRVLFVQKNNLPIIQLSLISEAGSKFDPVDKKGLSYLCANLLDEGAGNYNALELDEEFDLLGTSFSTSIDNDNVLLNLLTLEENFERSLELFSDVISKPKFMNDDFIREQKKLLAKIIQSKSQPSSLANKAIDKVIYQDNPYSYPTSGLEDDVKSITNDDIKLFYTNHYSPEKSCLVVVGTLGEEVLLNKLNDSFSNWKTKSNSNLEIEIPNKTHTKIYIIDKKESHQTEIRIGHISSQRKSPDYLAKVVMNTILGGQFSSRINLNLREDKGYTYGAHSGFAYNKLMSHFIVSTSVESKYTFNSIIEIMNELKGIQISIEDSEVEFAKSYLIKRFPAMFETYNNVSRNLISLIIHDLPFTYYNDYIKNLTAVTKIDVEEAARKNIFNDSLAIVLVGNEKLIRDQFKDSDFIVETISLN